MGGREPLQKPWHLLEGAQDVVGILFPLVFIEQRRDRRIDSYPTASFLLPAVQPRWRMAVLILLTFRSKPWQWRFQRMVEKPNHSNPLRAGWPRFSVTVPQLGSIGSSPRYRPAESSSHLTKRRSVTRTGA